MNNFRAKNNNNSSKNNKIFTAVLCLLLLSISSFGQQRDTTSENKSDSGLKSSARVNPSTLAMEFSLPLGGYLGRAGNSLPVSISYSSKLWESKLINSYSNDNAIGAPTYPDPRIVDDFKIAQFRFSRKTHAGWNTSLQPPKIIQTSDFYLSRPSSAIGFNGGYEIFQQVDLSHDFFEYVNNGGQNNSNASGCPPVSSTSDGYVCGICIGTSPFTWLLHCEYRLPATRTGGGSGGGPTPRGNASNNAISSVIKRARIQMPNGSIVEFRKNDTRCQSGFLQNGNGPNCVGDVEGSYLSVDGSKMRFEYHELQSNGQKRHVLYSPNGSRYLFPVYDPQSTSGTTEHMREANEMVDVNGNRMTFDSSTRIWVDSMGRQILNPFSLTNKTKANPELEETQIVDLPTMANTTQRQAQMVWKKVKAVGCETDTTGTCGENLLENPAQELKYIGVAHGWANDENDPVLFESEEWTTGAGTSTVRNFKERITGELRNETAERFNPIVLKEVVLPDGRKYQFKYNLYGEISKIIYPTGFVERFIYDEIQPMGYGMVDTFNKSNRGVVERKIYLTEQDAINDNEYQTWSYEAGLTPNPEGGAELYKVTITAPDESYSERFIHRTKNTPYGFSNSIDGMTYESNNYASPDGNGNKRLLSRTLTDWNQDGPLPNSNTPATRDPRPERSISITFEGGEALATMSETIYEDPENANSTAPDDRRYFARLNPIESKSYHFIHLSESDGETLGIDEIKGLFNSSGQLASISKTEYFYDEGYMLNGIPSLPKTSKVLNPNTPNDEQNVLAKTETYYDYQSPPTSNTPPFSADETHGESSTLSCTVGSNTSECWKQRLDDQQVPITKKGHPTTTRLWDDDNDIWIESHTQYDIFGNGVKTKDHLGREAEVKFNSLYSYAFPTKTISPAPGNGTTGINEKFESETTYDFMTGLVTQTRNLRVLSNSSDDLVSTMEYDEDLRPVAVVAANGARSETIYNDTPGNLWVKTRSQFDTNTWNEAIAYADNLGRTYKTRTIDSNGDVIVESKFDNLGRVTDSSNPYREGTLASGILWSRTTYDESGRVETVYAPTEFNTPIANRESIGTSEYGIMNEAGLVGVWTVSTDASGRKKRSISNSLGQLARVDEAASDKSLKGLSAIDSSTSCYQGNASCAGNNGTYPSVSTSYKYNIKGEMVEVTQGGQTRNFLYDSLGRLIRVKQPEQEVRAFTEAKTDPVTGNSDWTARMKYDVMGKVEESEDAKGTIISYDYDNGDRVLSMSYSDGTPTVTYKYDLIPNGKGALIETSNGISTSKTTKIDEWGRPTEFQQITDGVTYTSKYKYNLSGILVEETYPSNRVVKNDFNANGDLARIYGRANPNAPERTYANSFAYTAHDRVERLKLGNDLWEAGKFNNRLQVTELSLGNSASDTSLWSLSYDYEETLANGTTANTGNVIKQVVNFQGLNQPFVQTYKYDSLYRLKEAKEMAGTTENWKQNLTYDRYGNRQTHDKFINENQVTHDNKSHPTISTNTNRFNAGQGYEYDKVGNLTKDADNRNFTFDGNNKQTLITNNNGVKIGEYFYDGNGKRVKKKVYDSYQNVIEEMIFVYSLDKLTEEYSTATPPTSPTTNYTITDKVGSPRVLVDAEGNIKSRRDFMPFGEKIDDTTGERSNQAFKYGQTEDNVRQKFTGYERDDETGLDFAQARMYNNQHARFTAVDPLLASGKSGNPQTFNRYVYVANSPLIYTDPDGLQMTSCINCDIYTNAEKTQFVLTPREGFTKYDGPGFTAPFTDGYTYAISKSRRVKIGTTSAIDIRTKRSTLTNSTDTTKYEATNEGPFFTAGRDTTSPWQLFKEFAFGDGTRNRTFGPSSLMTEGMRTSPELDFQRATYCSTFGCETFETYTADDQGRRFGPIGWGIGPEGFGHADGFFRSIFPTTPRGFVGSFDTSITEIDGGNHTVIFQLRNKTGKQSLFYHLVNDTPNFFETTDLPDGFRRRDLFSNMYQEFWWTELNPCGCNEE